VSTTTLRLPDELRNRLAKIAEETGKTPHSLMLEAIAEKVTEEEFRAAISANADARYAALIESGKGIAWPEMRAYLIERAAGKTPKRPKAKSWR
jgi:predicted transcriptional regulator